MKQTAVEWLKDVIESFGNKHELQMSWSTLDEIIEQAKEMEKEQIIDAVKNELKLIGNYFDVSKLETKEQKHHIRFTAILKDRFDYYNKIYGGNK